MPKDHYVPQFYLRRFGNEREQLRAYRRTDRKWLPNLVSVKKVGAITDFYTLLTEMGVSREVETWLGDVETQAQRCWLEANCSPKTFPRWDERVLRTTSLFSICERLWQEHFLMALLGTRYASTFIKILWPLHRDSWLDYTRISIDEHHSIMRLSVLDALAWC